MNISQLCTLERTKETQAIKFYLAAGLTISTLVHLVVFYSLDLYSKTQLQQKQTLVEVALLDTPKPQEKKIETKRVELDKKPEPETVKETTSVSDRPQTISPKPQNQVQKTVNNDRTPRKAVRDNQQRSRYILTKPGTTNSKNGIPQQFTNQSQKPFENTTNTGQFGSNLNSGGGVSSNTTSSSNTTQKNPTISRNTGTVPRRQPRTTRGTPVISCVRNCTPPYPAILNGTEGRATIIVTIDSRGNPIDAKFTGGSRNFQVIKQAIIAAKKMKFSSPGNANATVRVNINFTVAGSAFDRKAKQRQAEYQRQQQQRQAEYQRQQQQQRQQRQAEYQRQQQQQQQQQQQKPELEKQREAERERQRKIDEILKRNTRILDRQ